MQREEITMFIRSSYIHSASYLFRHEEELRQIIFELKTFFYV